jgi:hypothetical protein
MSTTEEYEQRARWCLAAVNFKSLRFPEVASEDLFDVEASNDWSTLFVRETVSTLEPQVVSVNEIQSEFRIAVGGTVKRVTELKCEGKHEKPRERSPGDAKALLLNDNCWLIPRNRDVLGGTSVPSISGTVFAIERTCNLAHANCTLRFEPDQKAVFLVFSKTVPAGGELIMYTDSAVARDEMKLVWLKNMTSVLFEFEEDSWVPGQSTSHHVGKYLTAEFFSQITSFAACTKFLERHIKSPLKDNEDFLFLYQTLDHCVHTMKGTLVAAAVPFRPVVYPQFPLNHLYFAANARQFRFGDISCYARQRKLKYPIKYIEKHKTMHQIGAYFISDRRQSEFWEVLGDDGEYFDDMNSAVAMDV